MESSTSALPARHGFSVVGGWRLVLSCPALVGVGSSTLLGPEGSAVTTRPGTGGCVVGLLFLSSSVSPPCVGVWGLVGLLFEICIVDASIFTARNLLGVMPGGWCVVSV